MPAASASPARHASTAAAEPAGAAFLWHLAKSSIGGMTSAISVSVICGRGPSAKASQTCRRWPRPGSASVPRGLRVKRLRQAGPVLQSALDSGRCARPVARRQGPSCSILRGVSVLQGRAAAVISSRSAARRVAALCLKGRCHGRQQPCPARAVSSGPCGMNEGSPVLPASFHRGHARRAPARCGRVSCDCKRLARI